MEEMGEGDLVVAEMPAGPARKPGETPRQQIRKAKHITRRTFTAEDKPARPGIRIVMEGIRGELGVSELCRRERLHTTVYYRWLKDFMSCHRQIRLWRRRRQEAAAGGCAARGKPG